jgi:hypothetical protein
MKTIKFIFKNEIKELKLDINLILKPYEAKHQTCDHCVLTVSPQWDIALGKKS